MVLVLDVGNTNVTCGIFRDTDTPVQVWRLAAHPVRTADEYGLAIRQYLAFLKISASALSAAVVASVVPAVDEALIRAVRQYLKLEPLMVTVTNQKLLTVAYDRPVELGVDRVVTAGAAFRRYGAPLVVMNTGTATTIDAVAAGGVFLGGAICPGVHAYADSLTGRTALIPPGEISPPARPIGRNTRDCLRSGCYHGYLQLLQGLSRRIRDDVDRDARIVATGGMLNVFRTDLDWLDATDPDLTLIGIYYAFRDAHGGT